MPPLSSRPLATRCARTVSHPGAAGLRRGDRLLRHRSPHTPSPRLPGALCTPEPHEKRRAAPQTSRCGAPSCAHGCTVPGQRVHQVFPPARRLRTILTRNDESTIENLTALDLPRRYRPTALVVFIVLVELLLACGAPADRLRAWSRTDAASAAPPPSLSPASRTAATDCTARGTGTTSAGRLASARAHLSL